MKDDRQKLRRLEEEHLVPCNQLLLALALSAQTAQQLTSVNTALAAIARMPTFIELLDDLVSEP